MKNVIITGSANGVGRAVAQTLKDNNLILIDVDNRIALKSFHITNAEKLLKKFFAKEKKYIKKFLHWIS